MADVSRCCLIEARILCVLMLESEIWGLGGSARIAQLISF